MQNVSDESASVETWNEISPLLDGAMDKLGQKDHDALVLRFFENKNFAEVGAALGASEDAAKMRVNRALEKLRKFFTKRGVVSTATIIAGAISANSVQAAPVALAKSVTAVAIMKGAAVSASTLTLIKGALKLMAWTKIKMAIVASVVVLLAAGTATITIGEVQKHVDENFPWQVENPTPDMLEKIPALVKIVPTKFSNAKVSQQVTSGPSSLGIGVRIQDVLAAAYNADNFDGRKRLRMLLLTKIPTTKYDYIVNLKFNNLEAMQQELAKQSSGNVEALQQELKKQLGLVGRHEIIVTNVLLLKVKYADLPGLKPITAANQVTPTQKAGEISFQDHGCQILASALGNDFRMPVLDETGLTNQYYYDLKWNPSGGQQQNQLNLKQALTDQLGLEVVPSREPIEFLVVEKAK